MTKDDTVTSGVVLLANQAPRMLDMADPEIPENRAEVTRAEAKAERRRYYEANREAILAKNAAYRAENKEASKATWAAWHAANREVLLVRKAAYRAANKDAIRARYLARHAEAKAANKAKRDACREENKRASRARASAIRSANFEVEQPRRAARYAANRETVLAEVAAYRAAHPEKYRTIWQNRRARKRSAEGSHTADDIRALFQKQKGKCAYCIKTLKKGHHVDHVVPLSKGGSNWPSNLAISCRTCNLSKHAKDPHVFARQMGRLL